MKRLLIGVLAVLALAACSARDEASYRYGHDEITPLAVKMWNQGFGPGKEGACVQALNMAEIFGPKYVRGDVIAGCVDGMHAKR